MKQNEKHPHKAAVLATAIFANDWVESGEVSAVDFYNSLDEQRKSHLAWQLEKIMQAADVPQPAKMPLLSAVEIIRDHNEWRKANSEDEAPMPYPHSAELVGRAMERVCDAVESFGSLAERVEAVNENMAKKEWWTKIESDQAELLNSIRKGLI